MAYRSSGAALDLQDIYALSTLHFHQTLISVVLLRTLSSTLCIKHTWIKNTVIARAGNGKGSIQQFVLSLIRQNLTPVLNVLGIFVSAFLCIHTVEEGAGHRKGGLISRGMY